MPDRKELFEEFNSCFSGSRLLLESLFAPLLLRDLKEPSVLEFFQKFPLSGGK
jgi:hypothetical protein